MTMSSSAIVYATVVLVGPVGQEELVSCTSSWCYRLIVLLVVLYGEPVVLLGRIVPILKTEIAGRGERAGNRSRGSQLHDQNNMINVAFFQKSVQ